MVHSPLPGAAAVAVLLFCASPARAQSIVGGEQNFVWSADCVTDQVLTNNTLLTLAGLWIKVTVGPELETLRAEAGGILWDVDDNEDLDNDDAGENDVIDSTLIGPNGWHRVQARTNAALVAPGGTLNLRLCDSTSGSVATRTIFVIPIAQKAGQTGGDQGPRVQPPIGLNRLTPTGLVSIASTGAPPNSVDYAFGMVNLDGALPFHKLMLTPPTGVNIVAASGSSGGNFEPGPRIIVWPTPIPTGCIEQINTTVDVLVANTTVAYTFVMKIQKQ